MKPVIVFALALSASSVAHAASLGLTASAQTGNNPGNLRCSNAGAVLSDPECVASGSPTSRLRVTATVNAPVNATASSRINAVTGTLCGTLSSNLAGVANVRFANAIAFTTSVSEQFSVSGTGTVTAHMSYSADILASYFDGSSNQFVTTDVSGFAQAGSQFSNRDTAAVNASLNVPSGSSGPTEGQVVDFYDSMVTGSVSSTVTVTDGSNLQLSWGLTGQISISLGTFITNSANFWFETSDGVALTPSDGQFLSAPAAIAPVTLPASALLLGAGLGALRLSRRKRARRVTV